MKFKVLPVLIVLSLIVLFLFTGANTGEKAKKTVVLKFKEDNQVLNRQEFRNVAQDVVFFTDSKWRHVEGKFTGWGENEIPTAVVPKNKNSTLNFLWKVPSFGKTVLRLDLSEFKNNSIVNANEALTKQYLSKVKSEYKDIGNSTKVKKEIKRAERLFENNEYSKSLNQSLWILEKITLLEARRNIEKERKELYSVKVVDENDEPVENTTVEYTFKEHNFDFAWSSPEPDENLTRKMEELGFNTYQQFAFWYRTQPEKGSWNFERVKSRMKATEDFEQSISGIISEAPPYVSNFSDEDLSKKVKEHVSRTVQELDGKHDVSRWECYGFGMHYMADQSLQITVNRSKEKNIRTTMVCVETVKNKTDGDVVVTGWNIDGSEIHNHSYTDAPYTYYERLQGNFDIGFDFMYFGGAHEMPPELIEKDVYRKQAVGKTKKNWIPARSLYSVSEMLDWYSTLGKDIHIQYFQAPSNYAEGHKGYWKEPWDKEVQAEWIRKYYTLIYSKPYIESINYLEPTDSNWKDLHTGLLEENGTEKMSYNSLEKLMDSWRTEGTTRTGSDGRTEFKGYEGIYKVKIKKDNKNSSKILRNKSITINLN